MEVIFIKKLVLCQILLFLLLALAPGCMLPGNAPNVIVTSTPPAGEAGFLKGKVEGVKSWQYQIFVLLHASNGWWYKPYFGAHTYISLSGNWSCDVATGGIDTRADQYAMYLAPRGLEPPLWGGKEDLPDVPEAVDFELVNRQ